METIDITPFGAKTPEGVARINKAVDKLHDANAECANVLRALVDDRSIDDSDANEALAKRDYACEELVRAVAGRPAL